MILNILFDFFVDNGYIFEVLVCMTIFTITLDRRKHFIWRFLACMVLVIGISITWSLMETRYTPWDMIKFTSYFVIFSWMLVYCFKINIWAALFIEVGALSTQHIAYKTGEMILFPFEGTINSISYAAIYITALTVVYTTSYLLFARQLKKYNISHFESKQVIYLSMALLMFTVIFGQYYYKDNVTLYLTVAFYSIMCCILALWIQYGMINSAKIEHDFKVMEHVLYLKTKQMEISKENMDLINVKVHDLKHQIKRYEDRLSPHEVSELQNALSIYDMSIKTGHDALDAVLAEKSLICGRENIKMNCIADGQSLSFMHASDIYSLFGNAIDNAISAVRKIEEDDKRIIAISVKFSANMVVIHFENFYAGQLFFKDDLPLTTNEETKYHGFGLKSIKMITEKYKGFLSLKTDNHVFSLNILIPVAR